MSVTTENPSINGVDVATLFATLDAVKGQNQIADVPVPRHQQLGQSGTHSRSKFSGFYGAMQEMEHAHETEVVSDHPAVLVGPGQRPDPGRVPAARHRRLPHRRRRQHRLRPRGEAEQRLLDRRGRHQPARHPRAVGDGSVRNGYEQIKVTFHIDGDADEETLRGLVEQSRKRSAVYDALTNPTPVVIDVVCG